MIRTVAKAMVGIALCFSVLLPGWADAQVSFNQIITFGDSLSDPGNYWLLTGDFTKIPFTEAIPDSPYAIGGFHFSNGRTWIEQLATDLAMPTSGRPALLVPGVFTNYAVGRSRARPGAGPCNLCDLTEQVSRFLFTDFPQGAPPDALYVVFIGSNDLSDALSALFSGHPELLPGIIADAINSTASNIQRLWLAGARKFLVPNLPDFGLTPYILALDALYPGQGIQAGATQASIVYNMYLADALVQLGQLPGIKIISVNVFAALQGLVSDPQQAGFKNVDDSCLTFGVVRGAICSTPNKYLFWDGIHPTTAGHDFLSDQAKEALSAP